ncbi:MULTISPECIES: C40 family peptidase [Mycobacterium]|uniref:Glycoside hydrolase n=5 Tax=Mycobacterium TaxID=1763 RepID=A0A1X1YJB8_9MYCO|nr:MULTISPECIES: C40 family peptidase [Mycobacterium]MDA3641948.1 NlpC/P60 family protein [Mycobacterium xenopi]MDA3659835.1 NlpC/P60 family protein [Mycobacterium xenopi]MDA3664380.1 NlpC/P60 family protein [Mycobacterium xenopi]ORA41948.1 glycoside hydrolase [Mycobacterium bouchedurhonense]ORW11101.1 glycoside hydrolase [Mycobacterium kyorinense]
MTELATEHTDTATDDGAGDPHKGGPAPARPTPNGAVPLRVPPLPGGLTPNSTATPATPPSGATASPPAPNSTASQPATKPATPPDGSGKTDPTTKPDPSSTAERSESAAPGHPNAPDLSSLAALGPQLAAPLLATALGVPAAALQGAGQLIPGLLGAILPQLAALASQLGTTAPPGTPTSRFGTGPDSLTGPLSGLAGNGQASDQARATTDAMARRAAALRDVEHRLGEVLGLSSAKTDADRAKMQAIIDDVETALMSAAVQGDTPEAQAAVLAAMRHALDQAGNVVSSAARDKLTDAQFVRDLIAQYLSAGGDINQSGFTGSGAGADAVAAARSALGLPYVWGGGGALGPTNGGFDCSGLTQYAIARATGGRVMLPRTTYDQIRCGTAVPLGALQPGDLVFSNFSAPGVPEHVQLYIGGGQVIEAPQQGQPVQISPLPSGAQARRVL